MKNGHESEIVISGNFSGVPVNSAQAGLGRGGDCLSQQDVIIMVHFPPPPPTTPLYCTFYTEHHRSTQFTVLYILPCTATPLSIHRVTGYFALDTAPFCILCKIYSLSCTLCCTSFTSNHTKLFTELYLKYFQASYYNFAVCYNVYSKLCHSLPPT